MALQSGPARRDGQGSCPTLQSVAKAAGERLTTSLERSSFPCNSQQSDKIAWSRCLNVLGKRALDLDAQWRGIDSVLSTTSNKLSSLRPTETRSLFGHFHAEFQAYTTAGRRSYCVLGPGRPRPATIPLPLSRSDATRAPHAVSTL